MSKFSLHNTQANRSETKDNPVDPAALEAFAAGAKHRQKDSEAIAPWENYDPNDLPRYSTSIRLNEYNLEMLRYVCKVQGVSHSKMLAKLLTPLLKKIAEEEFEARRGSSSN